MLVTENLLQEHQLILSYIDLMDRYCYCAFNLENTNSPLLLDNAEAFIDFIHEFADTFHHAKEETILFRYLDMPGVLTHCNPVPQMLHEHEESRSLVLKMRDSLASKNLEGLSESMQQYGDLLKQHIFKEDNILYPMSERDLSDGYKTSILAEYAETDVKLNSVTIWQKYTDLLNKLKNNLTSLE